MLHLCSQSFICIINIIHEFFIYPGELFGLLGVNGAGKTSTFKMLTGDIRLSEGNAYLDGYDIRNDLAQVSETM